MQGELANVFSEMAQDATDFTKISALAEQEKSLRQMVSDAETRWLELTEQTESIGAQSLLGKNQVKT